MLNISMNFLYINIINFGGIYIMVDKVMRETLIEKESNGLLARYELLSLKKKI